MKLFQMILEKLIKLNHLLQSRFGSALSTILSIMAFFLVCSGLLTGLLGHGWGGAWFLVVLGLLLGILPSVNLYEARTKVPAIKEEPLPPAAPPIRKRAELDEATKKAIELEAALARRRILEKEEERRQKLREEQERREREAAEASAREYAEELKRRKEAKRKAFEQKERQEKQQKNFNQNYFKQEQFKPNASKPVVSSEFFRGITNTSDLKKRYLDLLKIYHPDNTNGDTEITKKLQAEYKELSTFFESYEKHQ